MTFEIGDKVKVVNAENLPHVDWLENGQTGVVVTTDDGYIEVLMDNVVDRWDNPRTFPFYAVEIENLTRPVAETVELTQEFDVLDTTGVDDYALRGVEYSGAFEFFHKPSGKVLLVTEFVSLDTLIRIVEDHQEGNR